MLSDSEEHGHEVGTENSNNATPVALSAEEQADAKRYSELFGGKPKVKSSAGGGGSSKRKAGSRQKKKKQRFDGNHVEGEQGDAGGDGDESAPGSPYRGKAAWAVGTAATGHGKAKECAPQALRWVTVFAPKFTHLYGRYLFVLGWLFLLCSLGDPVRSQRRCAEPDLIFWFCLSCAHPSPTYATLTKSHR